MYPFRRLRRLSRDRREQFVPGWDCLRRTSTAFTSASPVISGPKDARSGYSGKSSGLSKTSRRPGLITRQGPGTGIEARYGVPVSAVERGASDECHAARLLLALSETGAGGGDAGRRVRLVCAHCGKGIGVWRDHLDAAALLGQGLDLAC